MSLQDITIRISQAEQDAGRQPGQIGQTDRGQ